MLKFNVKVMNIPTANISKMVTDRENIAIVIKYEIARGLSIRIFTFDSNPFKGQDQGRAHFDCVYLENGDREDKHNYCQHNM